MNQIHTIFGAPGCGKTTYLLNLLEELLRKYRPDEIAFVSFTRKGSYEGRDRAMEKFGYNEDDFPYFRTLHSIAFRELGMSRYDMISRRHYKQFSKAINMNFLGYYTEDLVNNDDKYLFYCSLKKNNPVYASRMTEELDLRKVERVDNNYDRFKKEIGIVDFDDLLVHCIKRGKSLPVKVAIIDEAQDLTTLQWEFCNTMFKDCDKVYVAGDDDQAIYEWSGADVPKFLSISKVSKDVIILDKSYRLKSNILDFSKNISNMINGRIEKIFDPVEQGGQILFYNNIDEININSEESYYFLSRNNFFLNDYTKLLKRNGMVFTRKNNLSVDMSIIKVIRRYEKYRREDPTMIFNDSVILSYLRKDMIGYPPWYNAFNLDVEDISYYRDLFKNKADTNNVRAHVNTIHGVKGGEADNVVVRLDITRSIANNLSNNIHSLNSELRCLYVAFTRAKKNLHIVYSNTKNGFDDLIKGFN